MRIPTFTGALAWRAAKIAAVVVLLLFIWWALSQLVGYREGKALQRAETAKDTAVAAQESANATVEVAVKAEENRATVDAVRKRTNTVATASRTSPAAQTPVATDARDRLRAHDEFLCQSRPAVCEGRGALKAAAD